MEPIQIILIAAIVFILVAIVMYVMMGSDSKQKQKNIAIIRGSAGEAYVDEKDLQNKRRAEIAKKLKATRDEEKKGQNKATIPVKMEQAGLKPVPAKFWGLSILSAIVCTVLAKFVFGMSTIMVGLIFVIGLFGLPNMMLKRMIKKRQKKFLADFADALEGVVRLLKAGMPVAEAIYMMTREYEGPVGEEMSIIYDKQKIGIPLYEAASEGCRRMPLPEMQMFAAGLAIQAQTGSSLSEVLINLARVIRARFRLKRKIMALSSEAIASAGIIAALPPLVATGLYFVSPGYLDPLFETDFGNKLLYGALFWMFCGVMIMKKMINFKI